jgi:hypothetical protein
MSKTAEKTKRKYSVILETAEPGSADLVGHLKMKGIKTKLIEKSNTSHSGFDEIEYSTDSKKVLKGLLDEFWHDEALMENIARN